jgi:hypothetical protein
MWGAVTVIVVSAIVLIGVGFVVGRNWDEAN